MSFLLINGLKWPPKRGPKPHFWGHFFPHLAPNVPKRGVRGSGPPRGVRDPPEVQKWPFFDQKRGHFWSISGRVLIRTLISTFSVFGPLFWPFLLTNGLKVVSKTKCRYYQNGPPFWRVPPPEGVPGGVQKGVQNWSSGGVPRTPPGGPQPPPPGGPQTPPGGSQTPPGGSRPPANPCFCAKMPPFWGSQGAPGGVLRRGPRRGLWRAYGPPYWAPYHIYIDHHW
jgi:hypothetical protein